MANIIIPLGIYLLRLGATIDLRTYDVKIGDPGHIYNRSDFTEEQVNAFNASYYVLPDRNIPLSKLNLPIDMALKLKYRKYSFRDSALNVVQEAMEPEVFRAVSILVVAEYRTANRILKQNARPLPGWQKYVPESDTHYIDKLLFGGRCMAVIKVQSNVTGDVQIIRRILRDVLGTSGSITEETVDVWRRAFREVKENPEVRGNVSVQLKVDTTKARVPSNAIYESVEELLRYVNKFPEFVMSPPGLNKSSTPLYVSLKPLRDLDDRYVSLERNWEVERYLMKLNMLDSDVEQTYLNHQPFYPIYISENLEKFRKFDDKLLPLRIALRSVMESNYSLYTSDADLPAFKRVFELYHRGLDNTTSSYLQAFERLREEIAVNCENVFLRPVKGSLRVEKTEVVNKGQVGNLEQCQNICAQDRQCRAVGYDEDDQQCLIYYRSTASATINRSENDTKDNRIYDRKCIPNGYWFDIYKN